MRRLLLSSTTLLIAPATTQTVSMRGSRAGLHGIDWKAIGPGMVDLGAPMLDFVLGKIPFKQTDTPRCRSSHVD